MDRWVGSIGLAFAVGLWAWSVWDRRRNPERWAEWPGPGNKW